MSANDYIPICVMCRTTNVEDLNDEGLFLCKEKECNQVFQAKIKSLEQRFSACKYSKPVLACTYDRKSRKERDLVKY